MIAFGQIGVGTDTGAERLCRMPRYITSATFFVMFTPTTLRISVTGTGNAVLYNVGRMERRSVDRRVIVISAMCSVEDASMA